MPKKPTAEPKHLIIPGALLKGTPLEVKAPPADPLQQGAEHFAGLQAEKQRSSSTGISMLQWHLVEARKQLWDMICRQPPKTFEQAQAAVEAYKHVDRAQELCLKQLSQLSLPESPPEEKEKVKLL